MFRLLLLLELHNYFKLSADPNSTFCVQRLEQECQNLSPKLPASIAAIDLIKA